jgi:SAM-dependent methyltransferase
MTPGLETVVCNLCGEAETRLFARKGGFSLVSCASCGLVYVSPRLDAQGIVAHYNGDNSSRIRYYIDAEPADRRSFVEVLDRAKRLLGRTGDLLDVGPNVGTCLALARERGWRARGVELNAEAARHCREVRGLDVVTGTLDDAPFTPDSFDAVLMGDVIEHLPDPQAALRRVATLLRPGGALLISTPDIARWAARLLQVKPLEHLYYFTAATLSSALERAGLDMVEIVPFDRHRNLTGMIHSTTCGTLFGRLAPLFRLAHRLCGDVVVRLPVRENLLAVARRPRAEAQAV